MYKRQGTKYRRNIYKIIQRTGRKLKITAQFENLETLSIHVKNVKRFKYNEDLNKLPHALQKFFVTGLSQNVNPFTKFATSSQTSSTKQSSDPFALFTGPTEQENTTSGKTEQGSTDSQQIPPPTSPGKTTTPQPTVSTSSGPYGAAADEGTQPATPTSQASAKSSKSGHMTSGGEGNEAKRNVVKQGPLINQKNLTGSPSDPPKQDEREEPTAAENTSQTTNNRELNPENSAAKTTQRPAPTKEDSLTSRLSTALSSIVNRGIRSVYTPCLLYTSPSPRD